MNPMPHHSGCMMPGNGFQGAEAALSEPLAQLKREHGPLREMMDAFAREAAVIGKSDQLTDWRHPLAALKEKVDAFVRELDPHSEREEGQLFPLMAKYIGRQAGPIAVMEYEHEQAKQNLETFRKEVDQIKGPLNAARAKEVATFALQAHEVLTAHFMKEENVLFPMAERMLSAKEKETLSRAFGLCRYIPSQELDRMKIYPLTLEDTFARPMLDNGLFKVVRWKWPPCK